MTAWLRPDVSAQTIEIGSSYIHPDVRGTGLNGRMKRLMLGHAFAVGIRRVEFSIDARNARSQAAVARLGAAKEGGLPRSEARRGGKEWVGNGKARGVSYY